MVEIKYTGANGLTHNLNTENAADAILKLSHIPGYINKEADTLTNSLGTSLKERRKQRAADFAAGGIHQAGNQSPVASKSIGATTTIPGFGGLIIDNGVVVGARTYEIKVENGQIVGTSGMREEKFQQQTLEDRRKQWESWFKDFWGGWWSQNWRTYAYWA